VKQRIKAAMCEWSRNRKKQTVDDEDRIEQEEEERNMAGKSKS